MKGGRRWLPIFGDLSEHSRPVIARDSFCFFSSLPAVNYCESTSFNTNGSPLKCWVGSVPLIDSEWVGRESDGQDADEWPGGQIFRVCDWQIVEFLLANRQDIGTNLSNFICLFVIENLEFRPNIIYDEFIFRDTLSCALSKCDPINSLPHVKELKLKFTDCLQLFYYIWYLRF